MELQKNFPRIAEHIILYRSARRSRFTFWSLFDHAFVSQVDLVGYACGIFYGVFIPLCLAFLFAKQRMVMRQCETFAITTKKHQGKKILTLQKATTEEGWRPCKDWDWD